MNWIAFLSGFILTLGAFFMGYRIGLAQGEIVGENRILPELKAAKLEHLHDLEQVTRDLRAAREA